MTKSQNFKFICKLQCDCKIFRKMLTTFLHELLKQKRTEHYMFDWHYLNNAKYFVKFKSLFQKRLGTDFHECEAKLKGKPTVLCEYFINYKYNHIAPFFFWRCYLIIYKKCITDLWLVWKTEFHIRYVSTILPSYQEKEMNHLLNLFIIPEVCRFKRFAIKHVKHE